MTATKLLEIARGEIGVTEYPAHSNMQKYGEAYGWNGVAWCVQFIFWLFKQAGASDLFYGGRKTASCTILNDFHKAQGQATEEYQAGDIIFFNFNGKLDTDHVGICESCDGKTITTIDGNTSPTNEANGGAVMRRTRPINLVVAAYRPNYQEENKVEEKDNIPADWAKEAVDWAVSEGLMKGDQYGNLKLHDTVTREQLCVFLYRAFNG